MAKFFIFLIVLQVIQIDFSDGFGFPRRPRRLAPSALFDQLSGRASLPDSNGRNGPTRKKRNLSSIIALLWPQVVGPLDHGEVKEPDLEEVPKTALEHHLEHIRQKAKNDEELRREVREFMQRFARENPNFNFRVFALAHPELKPENPL